MADQAARQLQYEYKAVCLHTFWDVCQLKLNQMKTNYFSRIPILSYKRMFV